MDPLGSLRSIARRYAPEILSALAAAESAVEVALRRPGQSPAWFAAPTVALVARPLLGRPLARRAL